MHTAAEWTLKATAGGVLVVAFAILAQLVTPKRLAGILAAAPSVALGSLTVTIAMKGSAEAATAARGMAAGAAAFTAYCVVAVPALRRFGAWYGSGIALGAWILMATALFVLVAR